jgi:hypothetical protein
LDASIINFYNDARHGAIAALLAILWGKAFRKGQRFRRLLYALKQTI